MRMMAAPTRLLELAHQIEDLRLDGHVEGRGRLVGDQELRIAGERHGDHHPLPHAAGELMRIFARTPLRLGDADQSQHLHGASLRRLLGQGPDAAAASRRSGGRP